MHENSDLQFHTQQTHNNFNIASLLSTVRAATIKENNNKNSGNKQWTLLYSDKGF